MDRCYMCDELKVSDEHIPPQCLFPEGKDLPPGLDFRKNLITVPSCAEHNLRKSGDDEYLLFILVANINVNSLGLHQWRTKIRRAMLNRPAKKGIFKDLHPVKYQGINTGAYSIDFERLSRQFDLISRGIYFHHFRERWHQQINLAIPFAISTGSQQTQKYSQGMAEVTELVSQFLKDEPKLGDNEEIFYYQYKLKADSPGFALKMVFYGGIEVAAISDDKNEQPT